MYIPSNSVGFGVFMEFVCTDETRSLYNSCARVSALSFN